MKRIAPILITVAVIILGGAAMPTSSDRDLIVRLQGEVLVLQRQLRDLQESLDRHHETVNSKITRLSEQTEENGKSLSPIASRLNQAGALQLNGIEGLERRISEQSASSKADLKALSEEIKEIKAMIAKSATQR